MLLPLTSRIQHPKTTSNPEKQSSKICKNDLETILESSPKLRLQGHPWGGLHQQRWGPHGWPDARLSLRGDRGSQGQQHRGDCWSGLERRSFFGGLPLKLWWMTSKKWRVPPIFFWPWLIYYCADIPPKHVEDPRDSKNKLRPQRCNIYMTSNLVDW